MESSWMYNTCYTCQETGSCFKAVHEGHLGVNKYKWHAKRTVY